MKHKKFVFTFKRPMSSGAYTILGQYIMNHREAIGLQGIVKKLPVTGQKVGLVRKDLFLQVLFTQGTQGLVFPRIFAFGIIGNFNRRKTKFTLGD